MSGVLLQALEEGFGAECASMGEVKHALSLGFKPETIVYDSPVKTKTNIEIALKLGVYMNLGKNEKTSAQYKLKKVPPF